MKLIQAEFSINHVPQSTRNLLCKGSTQEIIKDFSGACVSTKGRYIPESERKNLNTQDKSAKNLGLYLFIQGPTNRSVDCKCSNTCNVKIYNFDTAYYLKKNQFCSILSLYWINIRGVSKVTLLNCRILQ